MASPWVDRLVEVWASPGKAGAGVAVGPDGVLTARHVVKRALDSGEIMARIVAPGSQAVPWTAMEVIWEGETWDLALLRVKHREDVPHGVGNASWRTPSSPSPVMVRVGVSAERECEAVGFPDADVEAAPSGDSAEQVRQSEQALGTLLPAGQGKQLQDPDRPLLVRWMPFDVEVSHPQTRDGWQGISGGGVVLPDGRLVGMVVAAEHNRDARRLYVVPLAEALESSPGLAASLETVLGRPIRVEVRAAPLFASVLQEGCLGDDGFPVRVDEASLDTFGVKEAAVLGEPTFLDYIPRDGDDDLTAALQSVRSNHLMLVVIGGSGTGKSRSAAEAVRRDLGDWRLLCPQPASFNRIHELPLDALSPAVVWLDDIERYDSPGFGDVVGRLRLSDVVIVGTIRHSELDKRIPRGDLRDPMGDALTDPQLVLSRPWKVDWSEEERTRVRRHVRNVALLQWVASGGSPSVWCVAGPELAKRLQLAKWDDERPFRYLLVRGALDWYRTGIGVPIPSSIATGLLASSPGEVHDPQEASDALKWALEAVVGNGRRTSQSLLSKDGAGGLTVHDYVQDVDARTAGIVVPDRVWNSALDAVTTDDQRFAVGFAAAVQSNAKWAEEAWRPLAQRGNPAVMFNIGAVLAQVGRSEEALEVYGQVVARFGDDPTSAARDAVAKALVNKAFRLGELGRPAEELPLYDELMARFGDDSTTALREVIAKGLANKAFRLGELKRLEGAVVVYDEVIARFGDDTTPVLREQVASAIANKGWRLDELGRAEEALAAYDQVIAWVGDDATPALREQVAKAAFNKGLTLHRLDRVEEELAAYDQVITCAGDDATPALREQIAKAILNKGIKLGRLDRAEEELAAYDQIIGLFGEDTSAALREQVAMAILNKGVKLGQLDRAEEELAAYDQIISRFREDTTPIVRAEVANALVNMGLRLGHLNRADDEIAAYNQVVSRVADDPSGGLHEPVAKALFNKGHALRRLGRSEEAVDAYDQVAGRYANHTSPTLREHVAAALVNCGLALSQLGRSEQEIAVYSRVVSLFGGETSSSPQDEAVATALVHKGLALRLLGRFEEAVAAYDQVISRFGDNTSPLLRVQVATALVSKGLALGQMGRSDEAVAVYDQVGVRFGDDTTPVVREQVAKAFFGKGVRLRLLERYEEAVAVYDLVVAQFSEDTNLTMREVVARTHVNQGVILGQLGHVNEALAAFDLVIDRFGDESTPVLREAVVAAKNMKASVDPASSAVSQPEGDS